MIEFNTDNLNERLYRRIIENVLINLKVKNAYKFLQRWRIEIFDIKRTNPAFFEHVKTTDGQSINPIIPSGVTGKYVMALYLHDDDNEFKDRENAQVIQHELCHAILYDTHGTTGRIWVDGVHKNTNKFTIKFWYWKFPFWKRFIMPVIDIRGLI